MIHRCDLLCTDTLAFSGEKFRHGRVKNDMFVYFFSVSLLDLGDIQYYLLPALLLWLHSEQAAFRMN